MNLSHAIKKIRQKSLLTQEQFAIEIGVAFSTINRWENGKAVPNITAMKRLREFCKKSDVSFDEVEEAWFEASENHK